jgi:hypothetical protein
MTMLSKESQNRGFALKGLGQGRGNKRKWVWKGKKIIKLSLRCVRKPNR